jgi:uncharacterized protein
VIATDRAPSGLYRPSADWGRREEGGSDLAFDRSPNRRITEDGHLLVERSNITKANVCPYFGREIPGWQSLGLRANVVYRLLRDPEELRKAAPTFRNLPVLREHFHTTAAAHDPDLVVGATGSDPAFDGTYLTNSLAVWPKLAVDAVERRERYHISAAYRYRPDMTPGVYRGEPYDGVMRDIRGNHVALVRKGRAGPDCVVGDQAPALRPRFVHTGADESKETRMAKKPPAKARVLPHQIAAEFLLRGWASPRLAADAELDLRPVVRALGPDPRKLDLAAGRDALMRALAPRPDGRPMLAQDVDVADVTEVLEELVDAAPQVADLVVGGPAASPEAAELGETGVPADLTPPAEAGAAGAAAPEVPPDADNDGNVDNSDATIGKIMEFLDGKLSPEDMAALKAILDSGKEPEGAEDGRVSKGAMDAAIEEALKAERAKTRAAREAEAFVTPYVGPIRVAMDSAEQVYRYALKALGVKGADRVKDVEALRLLVEAQPRPGAARPRAPAPKIAADSDQVKGYRERYSPALKTLV